MNLKELSGLEIMKNVKDGTFPEPTMAITVPMEFMKIEKGSVEVKAIADDRHLNPMGGVHGGFAATVLDTATGATVHTMLKGGEGYGTIELNVKLLRPVPIGKELLAIGKIINMSKRLGTSEATLSDSEGKIYAHATSTCMIFHLKKQDKAVASKKKELSGIAVNQ